MKKIVLLIFSILFIHLTSYSQYIQKYTYRVFDPSTIYAEQNAYPTAFTKLSDGGFCIGGLLQYWDESHIQDREYGRDFIMKIDSDFNFLWLDSGYLSEDRPWDEMHSVIETSDGIISVFDSTSYPYYFNYIHADSLNGSNAWNNVLYLPSAIGPTSLNKIFNQNDTLYTSGYFIYSSLSHSIPSLFVLKSNGDTLFKREYTSYVNVPATIELQIDAFNNFYLIFQNQALNIILQIDKMGNVIATDTISSYLSYPDINIISPSKVLIMDNINHSCYKILNNHGSLIDSIYIGSYILDFYPAANGNTFAYCIGNQNSVFGNDNNIFIIDSLGKINWSIRIDSASINCIKEIDSKIYASGGLDSVLFLILSPPNYQVQLNASSLSICPGDSIMLTASHGSHYYWSTGDTTQNIFIHQDGNYWVYVLDSLGCGIFSDTLYIGLDINFIDLGSDTLICNQTNLLLNAGPNFISYQWQDSTHSQYYNILSNGIDTNYYSCTVIDSNQCIFSDTVKVIFDPCLGIDSITLNNFILYPNPFTSTLNIINFDRQITEFTLYDFTGRTLSKNVINGSAILDMKDLLPGIYFLELNAASQRIIKKIIKE